MRAMPVINENLKLWHLWNTNSLATLAATCLTTSLNTVDGIIYVVFILLQSLDPLPMHGPELGVHADDIETPDIEQESKQEVLENKNVRHNCTIRSLVLVVALAKDCVVSS